MATDATGTPTALGIPKYDVNVDAPSGLGFNAAMDAIDSIITAQVGNGILKTLVSSTGDMIYASSANTPARLPIGASGKVLTVSGGIPSWQTPSSPSVNTPVGTSFPGSPADGDEYVYEASAGSVYWRFKWINASSKWVFIGGPPLYAEVETAETTSSTSYASLTTPGPSITLPFAGDYDVRIGAAIGPPAGADGSMSYDIGGTAAVDDDRVMSLEPSGGSSYYSVARARQKTGLSAVTLTAKYKVGAGSGAFQYRWIAVTPVRK